MYDFYIKMGCFGLNTDNFISCGSVENTILKVNITLYKYNELMDYIDCCRLFDKPLLEFNAIRHFIYNLHDRFDQVLKPLWMPKSFELYQKFVINHRHCGLYIKLELPEENIEKTSSTQNSLNSSYLKLRLIKK